MLSSINVATPSQVDLDQIASFIAAHPNYAGGYTIRVGIACEASKPNIDQLVSDLDKATTLPGTVGSLSAKDAASMRAKIAFARGDSRRALEELVAAAALDWDGASQIFNISGTKPGDAGGFCTWTLSDLDRLGENFPDDWRIPALRGSYFQFFTTFGDESLYVTAETQYRLAGVKAPQSPIPPFLLGGLRKKASFWTKKAWISDSSRAETIRQAATFFTAALNRDPDFLPARLARAEAYLSNKQYLLAIRDFTRVLAREPENFTARSDRGNAYMESGDPLRAISDFSAAIPLAKKKEDSYLGNLYENRGDAYMKAGDLRSAIDDYTDAIRLSFGGLTMLLRVSQIRALYPELQAMPDIEVARLMHDQFHPEVDVDWFSEAVIHKNGEYTISLLHELYEKRGDAHIQIGHLRDGVTDFQRIHRGIPAFAKYIDRWRSMEGKNNPRAYYVDVISSELDRTNPKLWVKRTGKTSYQLNQFEFACSSREMRTISTAQYDLRDNLQGVEDSKAEAWHGVIPESIGEKLSDAVCSQK